MEQHKSGRQGKGLVVSTIILAVLLVLALVGAVLLWQGWQAETADNHAQALAACRQSAKELTDGLPCNDSLTDSQLIGNSSANWAKSVAAGAKAEQTAEAAAAAAQKALQQVQDKAKQAQAAEGIDFDQLLRGDYSSIQGTWKNGKGDSFTITGKKITGHNLVFSDDGVTCRPTVTIAETPSTDSNVAAADLSDGGSCWNGIIFAARGIPVGVPDSGLKDLSNTSKDRIALVSNGFTLIFTNLSSRDEIYYRA